LSAFSLIELKRRKYSSTCGSVTTYNFALCKRSVFSATTLPSPRSTIKQAWASAGDRKAKFPIGRKSINGYAISPAERMKRMRTRHTAEREAEFASLLAVTTWCRKEIAS
jgi:hypothetical protein